MRSLSAMPCTCCAFRQRWSRRPRRTTFERRHDASWPRERRGHGLVGKAHDMSLADRLPEWNLIRGCWIHCDDPTASHRAFGIRDRLADMLAGCEHVVHRGRCCARRNGDPIPTARNSFSHLRCVALLAGPASSEKLLYLRAGCLPPRLWQRHDGAVKHVHPTRKPNFTRGRHRDGYFDRLIQRQIDHIAIGRFELRHTRRIDRAREDE